MLISSHLSNIIKLVNNNNVVSIVAPTGSGKSIGIPAALGAMGAKVFVSVPTRTAAVSLSEYQKLAQKSINSNIDVGYAAEGNINYTNKSTIVYATSGHIRRKLLSYFNGQNIKPIDFCSVLMVDEVHSGTLDITIILSLWQLAFRSGILVPRLIIASATPIPLNIEAVNYTVSSEGFPIDIKYLEKDITDEDKLYLETANLIYKIHNSNIQGHILVFASGKVEVDNIISNLKLDNKALIIPAHGAMKQEDLYKIYDTTNLRKVIVATNIAEMSITIEDIGVVIDTMIEKRAETSMSGGFRLATHYISKDSAKQRAGRTGRTRAGVCCRLITLEKYNSLEEHRPLEVTRIPIYEAVIELIEKGLKPEAILKGVEPSKITNAILLLHKLDMVDKQNNVKPSGVFASNLPLSIRNAAFLYRWISNKYPLYPGIVVASLIDCYGPNYFWFPKNDYEYRQKYFSKYFGKNDLETCLKMWNNMTSGTGLDLKEIANYCKTNSLNNKKISELMKIIQQCTNACNRLGYPVMIGPFTVDGVMKAAVPILHKVYPIMINKRDVTYFDPQTKNECKLDNLSVLSNNPPIGIISLISAEIATQRGSFCIVNFAIETNKDFFDRDIVIKSKRGPRVIAHSVINEISILKSLEGLSFNSVDIDREYTRWNYINAIETMIKTNLNEKQAYEALNCVERWLLTLAESPSEIDIILSPEKLTQIDKFKKELSDKGITEEVAIHSVNLLLEYLKLDIMAEAPNTVRNGNTIVVGDYSRTLPNGRLDLLLKKGSLNEIATMCLRYSCLMPRGQQWNIPLPVHELVVRKYGVTIEGFASPINSQIINFDLSFCSLFSDTDEVFGSIGGFFDQDFKDVTVFANPPYVESIMYKMATFIIETLYRNNNVCFISYVPKWEDSEYYIDLYTSPFLKGRIELLKGKHYYIDSNNNNAKVVSSFDTTVFVMSNNNNIDVIQLEKDILSIYV